MHFKCLISRLANGNRLYAHTQRNPLLIDSLNMFNMKSNSAVICFNLSKINKGENNRGREQDIIIYAYNDRNNSKLYALIE